ncbi:hypothetical protein AA14337_2950 [Acetobacter malorum DSM 14337]|uniref:Uracil-DNA glycosylase-like domain-containing protein n=1 Tax=Acetobacter malorum DSM 14337 TaxID=1307910 RepID=A0ABQ0PYR1_9PROT|nr:hypothetical protein [Acetobacter malorum]KXV06746.1 hypothetical protein AD930_06505 [Acetobacter malorum]GBQ84929.1 hypothetical protein AA14337_2950 [Acetobacter malorum DSM 14337]
MEDKTFPKHGQITCKACFKDKTAREIDIGDWHVVNDPGAWGASEPRVIVLGFSKGFTQANAFKDGRFEDVPFKKIRSRLEAALRRVGLVTPSDPARTPDERFEATELDFAFGSLVRCSLSRLNGKTGRYECSGAVMTQAFREPVKSVIDTCARRYLTDLPTSVAVVVMLGTGTAYVKACKDLMRSIHPDTFQDINPVSYSAAGATWVHLTHPSGMNGTFNEWLSGSGHTSPSRKRDFAIMALRRTGAIAEASSDDLLEARFKS